MVLDYASMSLLRINSKPNTQHGSRMNYKFMMGKFRMNGIMFLRQASLFAYSTWETLAAAEQARIMAQKRSTALSPVHSS